MLVRTAYSKMSGSTKEQGGGGAKRARAAASNRCRGAEDVDDDAEGSGTNKRSRAAPKSTASETTAAVCVLARVRACSCVRTLAFGVNESARACAHRALSVTRILTYISQAYAPVGSDKVVPRLAGAGVTVPPASARARARACVWYLRRP